MGILSTLNIGSSGLAVAANAISVVGHNVTNAATEGYSRQEVSTASRSPLLDGGFWVGQGVSTTDIGRATNLFIAERAISAQGDAASAETALRSHQLIETSFTAESGLSAQLSDFFDSLEALTDDPSSDSHRMSALSAGESLAESVRTVHGEMSDVQTMLADEISVTVDNLNDTLARVAQLNGLIVQNGSPDLMDERDTLIANLSSAVGATVDYSASGGATVFIGGHAAVMDTSARTLSATTSADGEPIVQLSVDGTALTVTDSIGGAAGGAMEGWQMAQSVIDQLNTFATDFSAAFNAQHAAGFDANGAAGGDVFSVDATDPAASFSFLLTDPDTLAAAADSAATVGDRGNLDALIDLKDSGAVAGSGALEFVTALVTEVGSAVAAAEQRYETDSAALSDTAALLDSIAGVDLDEEAADLLAWQAAYQAAARVISATDEMLGELMAIV